jgi:phage tail protein X
MDASTYRTKQDDVLDEVSFRFYGHENPGTVEAVLEANRGLADYGPLLPAGVMITFPVLPVSSTSEGIQLFS